MNTEVLAEKPASTALPDGSLLLQHQLTLLKGGRLRSTPDKSDKEKFDRKTGIIITNAHLDDPWQWPEMESQSEMRATAESNLNILDRHPDLRFTQSSGRPIEVIRKTSPRVLKRIQESVAKGQFELGHVMYVEPDCNIPSGPSFTHSILYAQREYYKNFHRRVTVAQNPDSFGHAGTLPKILAQAGAEMYVFARPERHELRLPHGPFYWEGDDGTRILAQRLPYGYTKRNHELEKHIARSVDTLDGESKIIGIFIGEGDHGGGMTEEMYQTVRRIQQTSQHDIRFGTLSDLAKAIKKEGKQLPVYSGELEPHAPGCYSSGAELMKGNREAEGALNTAEKISSMAHGITGLEYPRAELETAGKTIALLQFHDTLGATLGKTQTATAIEGFKSAKYLSEAQRDTAMVSIANNIHIEQEEGMTPLIAFNWHGWESRVPVEREVYDLGPGDILVDETGKQVPFQEVQSHVVFKGRHRISFIAELPSMGYRVYKLKRNALEQSEDTPPMTANDTHIENDRISIDINPKTGNISGFVVKDHDIQLFKGEGAVPTVMDDKADTDMKDGVADAWGHGEFRMLDGREDFSILEPPKLIENGPVKSVIRVKLKYKDSTYTKDYTMYSNLDEMRVDVKVDWHEAHKVLKTLFPFDLEGRENTFEQPYGTITRGENGDEVPGHRWVDVSGAYQKKTADGVRKDIDIGVSVINNSKNGYHKLRRELGMTELRTPVYSHHEPFDLDPGKEYDVMDLGIHEYSYSLYPHEKTWKEAGTHQKAIEFNQPPVVLCGNFNPEGTLPQSGSFAEVGQSNVVIDILKRAENPGRKSYIVHLTEMHNEDTDTEVRIGGRIFPVHLHHNGILALEVPDDPDKPVRTVDTAEFPKLIIPTNGHVKIRR